MKQSDNYNFKKDIKAGRIIGAALIVLGSILTGILVYIVSTAQSLPRILIAGPAILGQGIGMFIFPGGNLTYKEFNKLGGKKGVLRLWSKAPLFHKVVWIVSGVFGIVISFKIMIDQGFLAPL
ncbi:hypothetical protein [Winogradskyella flava]|uniref:hypothetical protein n=1 Tax=Winogradskyella flava TaxID=1884876 RepID=UPI002490F1B9|nr:hypothetical protein [Winogradskyella flava]